MAIQTELGDGQITPAARPVEAFIQPGQRNVAQPNALPQLGNPGGISTVGTGGTPSVQGRNSFADFAQALAPFSRELTQTLQTAGLMYADAQMKAGERYAREQSLAAMAANDADMEVSELERARTNRQVGAKDPTAGQFMSFLNPYFGQGVERGNAKLAGQKAEMGLPAYIAKNRDRVDYNAPDMGFGALAQLQAEYTKELAKDYGLSAGSPGFQKYTLPAIEKAQDSIQTKHLGDRKKYFDTVGVQQSAAQIRQMYLASEQTGSVEVNGRTFTRAEDPTRFRQMQQFKAQSILDNLLLRQSMPGEASERSENVYKELAKIADYGLDDNFNKFIDGLPSQQVLKDENGKAVINPATGRPFALSWGEVYRGTAIDSEMKYEEAAATKKKRERERALEAGEAEGGFEDGLYAAIQGIPPGPAQEAAATAFTDQWYRERGQALGISRSELAQRRSQIVKLDDAVYSEGSDPNAASGFFIQLNESYGQSFNATRQRILMNETAARILDPNKKESFIKEASSAIASREKEMSSFSGYSRARDEVIEQAIKGNLASYYDMTALSDDPRAKANVEASRNRQLSAFTPRANDLIAKEEARLKRRLTETEVRKIARAAVFGDPDLGVKPYGSGDGATGASGQNQKEYLFPGSRKSDEPSAPTPGRSRPAGKTYELSQLNTLQERRVLRQYKATAVLTPEATLQAWRMVQKGDIPPALNRAYRDAGASSAAEFVLGQLDVHRRLLSQKGVSGAELQKFNPPQDVRTQVLRQSTRAAAGGATVQSVSSNVQRTPLLAQLGGAALNALTGATPAAAGTLDSAPRQYGGTGGAMPRVSAPAATASMPTRQGPGRAAPMPTVEASSTRGQVAPPAPVLPAPAGGNRASEVAMASPTPSVTGGSQRMPVGQVRSAGLPGWVIDEAGNYFSPTEGRPTVEDPITNQRPRLRAMRFDSSGFQGPAGGFEKPVSVVYERSGGQPGVDLYFPSKRFPAVLGGVVKDVSSQGGPGSGYGNYVVVESVDPLSGRKVDVLYAHLADGVSVRPGQRIAAGQIIGKQGGTGRVVSQDGTIASIDFLEPRPAGSKDMTPYSGFDPLRRHVVKQLQSGGSGGGASGKPDAYLKRLSYLETRIRNIPNSQGSGAMGYFQAMGPFTQEAIAASGGISPRDGDYNRSAKATWAWIQKHRPQAAAAIKAGRYDEADRILRPTWSSLPGGSQAQPDYVQREARRYLGG